MKLTEQFFPNDINENEALFILSLFNFNALDWPFLQKIAGARIFLHSDIFNQMLHKILNSQPSILKFLQEYKKYLEIFYKNNGCLITKNTHNLPLFKHKKSPLVFYGRNIKENSFAKPWVAIVGSRKATNKGLLWSKQLAKKLASKNILVVSGGALGVDLYSHEGAVEADGDTCAILGNKVLLSNDETPHWLSHIKNHNFMTLTPFGPLTPMAKHLFVERNLYVVSMAKALVIVQGMKGSGTLHTAQFAKSLGIPIYAMAGEIDNEQSYVPNMLIAQKKAEIIWCLDEFASCISETKIVNKSHKSKNEDSSESCTLLPELLNLIKQHDNALSLNEIVALTKKPLGELQQELLGYELEGKLIKRGSLFMVKEN